MPEPLTDFVERIVRDRPDRLPLDALIGVKPHPWITRHGSGKRARIRMYLGGEVKYERRPEEGVWTRVEQWTMGAAL